MDFLQTRKALSPEEEELARRRYTMKVLTDVENELMGQIEIFEGRVPTQEELAKYGRQIPGKNGASIFTWKSLPVVEVIPSKKRRGVTIKTHKLAPKPPGDAPA